MPRSMFTNSFNPTSPSAGGARPVAISGRRANGNLEWWSYQQAFIPDLYFARPRVNRATLGQPPIPAGVCCQATQDGGAICSNGQAFPPDCPDKPVPNVSGVAEYVQQEGYLVPKPPPASVNGVCPPPTASETPAAKPEAEEGPSAGAVVGLAAAGALVYALVEGLI